MHKSLDEFEFWPDLRTDYGISCPWAFKKLMSPLFMPRHQKVAGYYVIPSEILSVRPSVCLSVRPSVRPSVSAHHHSCIGNSSYSFRPILLKLYRCFKDGLKICILFFQNPEIIFYHFFPIFNLDIFRALILQICIWSMYLVSATPPTVFGESFWNFTGVLRMVWRYAYCFFRILKLFFITFFAFLTDIFRALILQICIWSMYLVSATPPTVFGESFWNFTGVLRMVWRYAYCFFRILKLFFITFLRIFNLDIFRALILQICIWSMYLVSATPPTVFGESFWNFTDVLRMVWRYAYCFFRILKLFFITFFAFLT